jgi:hypothetical protein
MKITTQITMKAVPRILACLVLPLSACASLGRGAPAPQHYVLGTGDDAERAAPVERSAGDVLVIGLRPLQLAEYLANPFIVVRHGTHRIGFSEFDRWGEDLARGINRTLTAYMAARSPAHRVEAAPWPPGVPPEYLVEVHLLRFEGVTPEDPLAPTGEAHLLATWEILRSGDAAVLERGTTEVRSDGWTIGDFDELVGLLDAALGTLAEDLGLGLDRARATR